MSLSELKDHIREIPNILTLTRLLLVPVLYLLAFLKLTIVFTIVYIIAGLTDVFDGFFARLLKQTSSFGAWFDSLADIFYEYSVFAWFFLLFKDFFIAHWMWFALIAANLIVLQSVAFWKTGKIASLHTILIKIAAFILVVGFGWFLIFGLHTLLFYILVAVIAFAQWEMILIYLFRKDARPNMKGLLQK